MKSYAIFYKDLEIHIDLREGDIDAVPSIRDEIIQEIEKDPEAVFGKAGGYVEQYPFYQCDWEIVGSNLPPNIDYSLIVELES